MTANAPSTPTHASTTHYNYTVRVRTGDGQTVDLSGTVVGDSLVDAVRTALGEMYQSLTEGQTTYGVPGAGKCRGPYQVNQMRLERVTPA